MSKEYDAIVTLNSLKDYYNNENEDNYVGFDNEDNTAIDLAIELLEQAMKKNANDSFKEVVDFFNDIMETLYKDFNDYKVSSESVIYARNRVYDVFSRRYKIKEIEKDEKK